MYKVVFAGALVAILMAISINNVHAKTINIDKNAYIKGNKGFDPMTTDVKVGEGVVWHNSDSVPHTATSGSLEDPNPGSIFNTQSISPGSDSQQIKLSQSGDVVYFCQIHPFIVGKLVVK
jgi:plastocyanin